MQLTKPRHSLLAVGVVVLGVVAVVAAPAVIFWVKPALLMPRQLTEAVSNADGPPSILHFVLSITSSHLHHFKSILCAERPRSGGRGGGRGRGRGRGGERTGKREFDRHDASGRGHETEKRGGGGRGNWGAEGDEIKAEEKAVVEGEEAVAAEGEQAPPVEEEKQLSLEEYEAMLAEKRATLNTQREAAFKVDEAQFQGMKTFAKDEEDVGLGLNKNAKSGKTVREKERKEKVVVDVAFRVQPEAERREKGRAPSRGGRGRGDKKNFS